MASIYVIQSEWKKGFHTRTKWEEYQFEGPSNVTCYRITWRGYLGNKTSLHYLELTLSSWKLYGDKAGWLGSSCGHSCRPLFRVTKLIIAIGSLSICSQLNSNGQKASRPLHWVTETSATLRFRYEQQNRMPIRTLSTGVNSNIISLNTPN